MSQVLARFVATSGRAQALPRMKRLAWVLVIACAACGGSDGGAEDPDGGGGGSGSGSDGSGAPTETKSGIVTIESTRYTVSNTEVEQGYASGTFYRIPPVMAGGMNPCTTSTFGACEVQTCRTVTTTSDGGVSITYTDSGLMTISGVQVNDGTMTLTPGQYGYITVSGGVALFNGGDTVRFVAPGNPNGAPSFDVSLVAPTSVQVTAPSFVQGSVTASSTQDLAVAWTGSATSGVTAQLSAGTTGMSAIAHCSFSGSAGHGVVPAGALSAVRAVGGNASIIISAENKTTKEPNGWKLSFSLLTYGLISSGVAVGTLVLQ
jgi:hypothetical protein